MLFAVCVAMTAAAASEKLVKVEGNIGGVTDTAMGTVELGYDAQGRLTSFRSGSSSTTLTDETITYADGTVTVIGKINGSEGRQVYTIGNDGLASACTVYDKDDAVSETYAFEYTGGRLVKVTETKGEKESVTEFSYLAGSLVSLSNSLISATIVPGLLPNVGEIPDLIQLSGVGACQTALYAGLLGKGSLMLPKLITITIPKVNIPMALTMDYERDARLRVTKLSASVASQNLVTVSYTYGDPADVSGVKTDASSISVENGYICNPSASDIVVHTLDGRISYQGNNPSIPLQHGIYIVEMKGKTMKVVVK